MGTDSLVGARSRPRPWVVRATVAAVFAAAGIAFVHAAPAQIHDRLLTRWLFAWQEGMPSRALAGTALRAAVGDVDLGTIYTVARAVQLALIGAVSVMLSALVVERDGTISPARGLMAATVAVSAVGLPSIGAGAGLLDQVVLLLALVAGWAITSQRQWIAGGLLTIAVLVHEPALLMVGVWLCAYTWWRTVRAADVAVVGVPPTVAAVVMAVVTPTGTPGRMIAVLSRGDVPVLDRPVHAQYWGVGENLRFTWEFVVGDGTAAVAASVLAALPLMVACWVMLRRVPRPLGRGWILVAAAAAPLPLSVLAVDWGRWFGMSALLAAVTVMLLDRDEPIGWPHMVMLAVVALGTWATGPVVSHAALPFH